MDNRFRFIVSELRWRKKSLIVACKNIQQRLSNRGYLSSKAVTYRDVTVRAMPQCAFSYTQKALCDLVLQDCCEHVGHFTFSPRILRIKPSEDYWLLHELSACKWI